MDWDTIAREQILHHNIPAKHCLSDLLTKEQKKEAIVHSFEQFISFLLCSSSVELLLADTSCVGVVIPVTSDADAVAQNILEKSQQEGDNDSTISHNGNRYRMWYMYLVDDCEQVIDTITNEYIYSDRFLFLISTMRGVKGVLIDKCFFLKGHILVMLN
jgi:uncharacterized protein YlaI